MKLTLCILSILAEILLITLPIATMKQKCLNVAIKYFYLELLT